MNDLLIHRSLNNEKTGKIPFWFMRQAGRYLPEYRAIRAQLPNFLDLCYTPELAAEVTLQPIRRFDMSAAIIFSDILVIPHAMGCDVRFEQGEGPKLSVTRDEKTAASLNVEIEEKLHPVTQALAIVRKALPKEKSLIGFCGAPWTVACYMVAGGSERDYESVRIFAYKNPVTFSIILEKIITASVKYLSMQVSAGADMVQIFDSWAGVLSPHEYQKYVIEPNNQLISQFKILHPDIAVIGFARGSGLKYATYAEQVPADIIGIDVQTPLEKASSMTNKPLQGNLDPVVLLSDKEEAVRQTRQIIASMAQRPFIFNLGHGILQHTPIENVEAVCEVLLEKR